MVDAEGSISFELTPLFLGNNGNQGIITPISSTVARLLYFSSFGTAQIFVNDTANAVSLSNTWSTVGQTVTVKARWGRSTMRLSVDGTLAASATYDGSFNASGLVTLFKSLAQGAAIKNLTLWGVDNTDSWLSV